MISTTNIPESKGNSISKTMQPGQATFKVLSVKLDSPPYDANAYNLILSVEGKDMGPEFEGFFIDKDNESLGRHKGQVGNIRLNQYPLKDAVTKTGVEIKRDLELLKQLKTFCLVTDSLDWFSAQDNKHNSFDTFVAQLNSDKPFADKWVNACVGGSEYVNKAGYTNYDLFIVKPAGQKVGIESAAISNDQSKLIAFDENTHIRRKKVEEVKSFGDSTITSAAVGSDFEL